VDDAPFDREAVDAMGHEDEVVVRATGLSTMGEAGASQSCLWAGWRDEDRARVERAYEAGLVQIDRCSGDDDGIMSAHDHRAGALLQSMASELAARGELETVPVERGTVEVKYDDRDLGWIRSGFGWLLEKLDIGLFDWTPPAEEPVEIADDARIAILGDWGSGRYGAPSCATTVATDPIGFDVVLHLGDVYYSGTTKEVRSNFLRYWPWTTTARTDHVLFRACNSNHEMYSGGRPYVDLTLREFDQPSSAFALQNEHWLFVGLDTAYDEGHLAEGQVDWLHRLLERSAPRQVVLFSHHPPFSHFAPVKASLVAEIEEAVREGHHGHRIHAWYWGHEHLGMVFEPDDRWGVHGRCVGHSGFPYTREPTLRTFGQRPTIDAIPDEWLVRVPRGDAPAALVVDGPNPFVSEDVAKQLRYGPNGFMTIECDGDRLNERLLSADGRCLWEGTT